MSSVFLQIWDYFVYSTYIFIVFHYFKRKECRISTFRIHACTFSLIYFLVFIYLPYISYEINHCIYILRNAN